MTSRAESALSVHADVSAHHAVWRALNLVKIAVWATPVLKGYQDVVHSVVVMGLMLNLVVKMKSVKMVSASFQIILHAVIGSVLTMKIVKVASVKKDVALMLSLVMRPVNVV